MKGYLSILNERPQETHDRPSAPWSVVAKAAAQVFRDVSRDLPLREGPPSIAPTRDGIAAYEAAVADIRRNSLTSGLPNDAVARGFALGFVLDQFARNLEGLLRRMDQIHAKAVE
ncbi:MAG TPA: hypothetical protein VF511_00280 [Chthoniobacterales bacterium]|jgi:hypothetical protein